MLSKFLSPPAHQEIQFMALYLCVPFSTATRSQLLFAHPHDLTNKRFCTLNLTVPMEVCPDHNKNLPMPHLIFCGTFKGGEDWANKEERSKWDPRVVVSFQENVWVNARTHIYGLKKTIKPINEWLSTVAFNGLQFEDNLSAI